MECIRIHKTGGTDVLSHEEKMEIPSPSNDQILVRMAAAGVNFIDTYHRSGLYPVKLPFVLGKEGSGTVVEVGADVKNVKAGDRVVFFVGGGCYAGYNCIPASKAVTVPADVSLSVAAAVYLQGLTAHYLSTSSYPVQRGDSVLVHAGAGGTGGLLVQIAKMRGATVIATVGSKEKEVAVKKLGADHVVLYNECDFVDATMELTGGKGVRCVFDGVGKATWERSLKCVQPLGTLILFGNASGAVPPIDPLKLTRQGSVTLIRPSLAHYIATPSILAQRTGDLFRWISSGELSVRIGREFKLSEAAAAHEYLQSRQSQGKILLVTTEDTTVSS